MAERTHPRLTSDVARSWTSIAIGLPSGLVLSVVIGVGTVLSGLGDGAAAGSSAYFVVWAVLGVVLIVLTIAVFARADGETLARWLAETTPPPRRWRRIWWAINGGGAVSWAVTVSAVTLGALITIASEGRFRSDPVTLGSGLVVLVSSFALIIVSYAVRYAREYATAGGIEFRGDREPRFADFVYLSVQVMTTFSTSDVDLTTTGARTLVSVHSIVAFAFNSGIVALLVGILINSVA